MKLLTAVFIPALLFGGSFCVSSIENPSDDPYLEYALMKAVERAIIESGYRLDCSGSHEEVKVKVVEFKEIPIAYTPRQRVSLYNLVMNLKVRIGGREFVLSSSVPYSLPSGSSGDIPRRKAIDDLTDKIYSYILQNLRR